MKPIALFLLGPRFIKGQLVIGLKSKTGLHNYAARKDRAVYLYRSSIPFQDSPIRNHKQVFIVLSQGLSIVKLMFQQMI